MLDASRVVGYDDSLKTPAFRGRFRLITKSMESTINYMSANKLDELKAEFEQRVKELRPQIARELSDARDMGDLSENFAYHDARDRQAENETRIVELEDLIRSAVVTENEKTGSIDLGSTFVVKAGSAERTFTLVGETEASPMEGKISHMSPLGHAFRGHKPGDSVDVQLPAGTVTYEILKIV